MFLTINLNLIVTRKEYKMNITQLCYASKRIESEYTLLDDLREILVKSRDYNAKNDICGVLYYAHGYYFQCVQGKYESVIALYHKIIQDTRHSEIKLIQHKSIEKRCFEQWSMKYVQQDTELSDFFINTGMNCFRPLEVTEKMIDNFIDSIFKHKLTKKEIANQGFMNRGYCNYF